MTSRLIKTSHFNLQLTTLFIVFESIDKSGIREVIQRSETKLQKRQFGTQDHSYGGGKMTYSIWFEYNDICALFSQLAST